MRWRGSVDAADLFAGLPVALLRVNQPTTQARREKTVPEHEFAVWAPKPALVRLDVAGALYPMTACDDGWWRATVDVAADARYGFVLDDDPTVLPDPRSPHQPDGVHERSQLWRPAAEAFSDGDWAGRSIEGAVIYELHIGTFTPDGTLNAAIDKLDYLVDLGVDLVELMPVNAFSGTHGWGYDGVLWYAAHEPYGGPDALVGFIDACHARGWVS
jgi:maltooligosyltrehalose trehalohydrolase